MKSERPLQFILKAESYRIDVALFETEDESLCYVVDFEGSPKNVDYEALDSWVYECEKIFYSYNQSEYNEEGEVQELLLDLILSNIKAALSTDSE